MGERGVTLIELLVSLVLLVVAVSLACQLLLLTARIFNSTGKVLHDSSFANAAAQLRRDINDASSMSGSGGEWTDEPLLIFTQSGPMYIGKNCTGELERGGEVLLRRVQGWQWRTIAPGVIQIVIYRQLSDDPWSDSQNLPPRLRVQTLRRTETLIVAARNIHGGRAW